jgi:hypothetical protein
MHNLTAKEIGMGLEVVAPGLICYDAYFDEKGS